HRIVIGMRENIEKRFPQAVRCRPDRVGSRALQRPAFQAAADNAHEHSRFSAGTLGFLASRRGISGAAAPPLRLAFRAFRTRIIVRFWSRPAGPGAAFFPEAAAAPGKGLTFTWPFRGCFFAAFLASASQFELLDIHRPPGAIGRLAALDTLARTARLALFDAYRGNMFTRAGGRFDLRFNFGFDVKVAIARGRYCHGRTSRPALRLRAVRTAAGPGLARPNHPGHFRHVFFVFKRAQKIRASLPGERWPQLIAEHPRTHLLDRALGDIPQLEGSEGKPDQAVDLQPEMFEHAFDLAVLAFTQRHRQPAIGALHAIERRLDARVPH